MGKIEIEDTAQRDTAKVHDLKVWTDFFPSLLSGEKTFELRFDDRGFRNGDLLTLREFEPESDGKHGVYTGRCLHRAVTYVLKGPGFGLREGWVCLALRQVDEKEEWICLSQKGEPGIMTNVGELVDSQPPLREP